MRRSQRSRPVALALLLAGALGCSQTRRVSTPLLPTATLGRPTVIYDDDGNAVRLGPRSELRFHLADGPTPWIRARTLRVDDEGDLFVDRPDGSRLWIRQTEVVELEVRNLDGPASYAVTLGVTVAVAAVVVLVLYALASTGDDDEDEGGDGGEDDGGDEGEDDGGDGGDRDGEDQARRVARRPATPRPSPLLRSRGAPGRIEPGSVGDRPGDDASLAGLAELAEGTQELTALALQAQADAGITPIPPGGDGPLFAPQAVRRSEVTGLVVTSVAVSPFNRTLEGFGDVAVGFRFAEAFDLLAGARLYGGAVGDAAPGPRYWGFARLAGHFALDPRDDVGAPIGLDFAFGEEGFQQLRLVWGFRITLADFAELQILPLNPQLTILDRQLIWSAPSGLQLGWRF